MAELATHVRALTVDIFGTTVDWWTGVADQASQITRSRGLALDGGALATAWRQRYLPSMAEVREGRRPWAYLDTLHRESLDELLVQFGVADQLDEPARRSLVQAWHRLPAWPDVPDGLRRLRQRYPVVALSNGGFALLVNLLKHSGLVFDGIVSAQHARTYKPDARVYQLAAELLDVRPDQLLMVACHRWDLDGARAAGLHTAFVERPAEKGPNEPADRAAKVTADLTCASFTDLADALGC